MDKQDSNKLIANRLLPDAECIIAVRIAQSGRQFVLFEAIDFSNTGITNGMVCAAA